VTRHDGDRLEGDGTWKEGKRRGGGSRWGPGGGGEKGRGTGEPSCKRRRGTGGLSVGVTRRRWGWRRRSRGPIDGCRTLGAAADHRENRCAGMNQKCLCVVGGVFLFPRDADGGGHCKPPPLSGDITFGLYVKAQVQETQKGKKNEQIKFSKQCTGQNLTRERRELYRLQLVYTRVATGRAGLRRWWAAGRGSLHQQT